MGIKLQQLISRLHPAVIRSHSASAKADVPKGHFAVYVDGERRKRFVVPTSYLKHPSFQTLLERAEEEFGFRHEAGGLILPCTESDFVALVSNLCCPS
ncbi:Auxin-induced protein 10A5 [Ananas comosus]|uniref:Auxin-induced protein 10A5 n=1 Tax=Ananas comosus TaxID=4615 RepID=A0A199W090_ANACO|nr:Auxin-induced protein 10A5 [Ananas comosus]